MVPYEEVKDIIELFCRRIMHFRESVSVVSGKQLVPHCTRNPRMFNYTINFVPV